MNQLPDSVDVAPVVEPTSASDLVLSLLMAAHSLEDRIEQELDGMGLSLAKLNVLSRMAEAGEPLALGEIAARLNCVRSNVTQLIDRLEGDGLVRREADSGDRRSIRAVLTVEGRSRQSAGASALAKMKDQLTATLPASDRSALVRALGLLTG